MSIKQDTMLIKDDFWYNVLRKSSYIEKYDFTTSLSIKNLSIEDNIPDEPDYLSPNNFTVSGFIDDIKLIIETTLSTQYCNSFTSFGTTWTGVWVNEYGDRCTFQIQIYKNKNFSDKYIIESNRTGGDAFAFKYFFSFLKRKLIEK
jgi:hypothetical protein